ncbi:MAG: LamG domain-containing protein [bacterium]|nr:LamG domain-containing protein [bacterium]
MVTVKRPPFSSEEWTHVCFTWSNVNASDDQDAVASLYLNGKLAGSLRRPLQFTWNPERTALMIGLNYIGLMDELQVFDRALSTEQVSQLYGSWMKQ